MKVLVLYDSQYGNTEKIAQAIGSAIAGDVKVLRVGDASPSDLGSIDLLIAGSPTQGGRATTAMQNFLKGVSESAAKDMHVAAFDTRFSTKWVGVFGYAAGRIASDLKGKGANLVVPPEGFFVKGGEGPLKEGELERAAGWVEGVVNLS